MSRGSAGVMMTAGFGRGLRTSIGFPKLQEMNNAKNTTAGIEIQYEPTYKNSNIQGRRKHLKLAPSASPPVPTSLAI